MLHLDTGSQIPCRLGMTYAKVVGTPNNNTFMRAVLLNNIHHVYSQQIHTYVEWQVATAPCALAMYTCIEATVYDHVSCGGQVDVKAYRTVAVLANAIFVYISHFRCQYASPKPIPDCMCLRHLRHFI